MSPRRAQAELGEAKVTEKDMLEYLRKRYTEQHGNGEAWAFVPKVRNAASFDGNRTIDAIAMALWKSRGLLLHGFEIKCSRADWLRELKNPAKAEDFCRIVDRFWLVVADEKFVLPGELPDTWGLLALRGGRLYAIKEAPALDPEPVSRTFLAALLRSACRVGAVKPEEVTTADKQGYERGEEQGKRERDALQKQVDGMRAREQAFAAIAGVTMYELSSRWGEEPGEGVKKVAEAVRMALQGEKDFDHLRGRLKRLAEDAAVLGEQAERIRAEHFDDS